MIKVLRTRPSERLLMRLASPWTLTTTADELILTVVGRMADEGVPVAVVVDPQRGGRLSGIFSERELLVSVARHSRHLRNLRVGDLMRERPPAMTAHASRAAAFRAMLTYKAHYLPLTDGKGRPCGILELTELARYQMEQLQAAVDSMESYMAADGPGG